jgi:hypothetical protein
LRHAATIEGRPGIDGEDGETPDAEAITQAVLSQIRQPEDGKTPVIDHAAIAQKAAQLIKITPPKNGKDADPAVVVDLVLEKLLKEKPLTSEHIKDFSTKIAEVRNAAAVGGQGWKMRGGGDVVAAGTNVTITTTNGVKTISATGGSGSAPQIPTGTVDGSNTTFVAATTPTIVYTEGGHFVNGFGVTITGLNIVFDAGLQPQSWIYYL